MVLLLIIVGLIVIVALVTWSRRFRAYGLAIAPKRRRAGVRELRLANVRETAPDRLTLQFQADPEGHRSETFVVELDDRALALETLDAWREERVPVTVTPWGQNLIRVRPLDGPNALTLRRAPGPSEGDGGAPDEPS